MDSKAPVSLLASQGPPSPSPLPLAPVAQSGTFLIRAPLSSEENDSNIDSDGGGTASEADSFVSGDEDFETASERPFVPDPYEETLELGSGQEDLGGFEEARLPKKPTMPKAQLSRDDDDVGLVVDGGLVSEVDGDGFPIAVRAPPFKGGIGSPSLVDRDGVLDDVVSGIRFSGGVEGDVLPDSSGGALGENPNSEVHSESGVLGSEDKKPMEELFLDESSQNGILVEVRKDVLPENLSRDGVAATEPSDSVGLSVGIEAAVEENGVLDAKDERHGDLGSGVVTGVEKHGVLDVQGEKSADLGSEVVAGVEENRVLDAQGEKNVDLGSGSEEVMSPAVEVAGDSQPFHVQSDVGAVDGAAEKGVSDALDEKNESSDTGFEEATSPVSERVADLKHAEAELDAVRVEKDVAPDSSSSVQILDPLTAPVVEKHEVESESPESKGGFHEIEKDEPLEGASVSVVSPIASRSVAKHDDVNSSEAIDGSLPQKLETDDEKPVIESEQAPAHLEENSNELTPKTDADGGDVYSVEELKSLLLTEGSDDLQVDRGTLAISGVADNGNANAISLLEPGPEVKPNAGGSLIVDVEENTDLNEVEEEEGLVSEGPAKVAILGSSETARQIIKELEEGSSGISSGFGSSRSYSHQIDGQIVSDSDEEVETDEEGDGKELFDSAALAALLKAATGASSDGNITISAPDAARIFSVDRPAGLGSSVPSLRPASSRPIRSDLFTRSDLTVVGEPENNMDEEEKMLQEKVEQVRVKFLRLVQRLGHSPEDTVAAQVLYRLGLAEGIRRGRQASRAFNLENARKKALQLEADGNEDLDFFCNILVLGKTGVGKSATINSIFGEQKAHTNAFEPATTSVKEILGTVDGVKIRVIDTPGLRPSVMDQSSNKRILSSIKKYTKKCSPDIVLYVDRLDTQTRDFNDLPLLRSIASTLGSSIWFNAIVALTHAASAPPDGPNGSPLSYEVFIAQRSHVVQHSIRQAAGDMRLMNPVALVENHPSCRRNREGQRVLPNGLTWRPQLLLLCYSSKILSEANSLLKLQDPPSGKLFGFRVRSPPLPFLLSSLLQSRAYPKLAADPGGDNGDSDIDVGDLSDSDPEEEEDEYDQLPPFKPLRKSQIAKLTKEQRKAYFDEYDYRVKLLQKKQWKEELRRLKEMKKRGKAGRDESGYGDMAEDFDQDGAPAAVPVPLPDMVLPPSFDCDNPAYRYRFLEPTSQLLARPVLDTHGWDHDCGYDGVSLEENLAIAGRFPAGVSVQITKDKKEFNIHLDSSVAAKLGENGSALAGFDIQSVGKQLAYILRSETKFKNLKKNKPAAGISVTFLGENIATGLKFEDQVLIGKRASLVASAGAVRAQGDVAYGANLEARLREKDFPIGQDLSTLGLSLMRWRGDLALGANLQSQFSVGRNSKMAVRVGLNNKLSGQITVRTSSSEQLQLALLGIIPIAVSVFRSIRPGESY